MKFKCKDCGGPADPNRTMVAADYGCTGPDLHFCKTCDDEGDAALVEALTGEQGVLN